MSELADRLRRLRRDDDPARVRTAGVGRAGPPAWLRERLALGARAADPRATVEPPRDLCEAVNASGRHAHREEVFALDHEHGDWTLREVDDADPEVLALVAKDPACGEVRLCDCAFLDVETTGLSGGAGTTSFLVALGSFDGDGFRLWQGFLREPAEEASMLAEVARRVGEAAGVVSFFGKSFDRHRLEDKMRVHGVRPTFDRPHLDLYWPVQRLYGEALPDGRLQTAEAHLLGLARTGDLPGSRAPEAWFDFLAGRGHRLEDVFRHNRDDVLSLVVLAAHLGRSAVETRSGDVPLAGPAAARAAGLGRLLADARDHAGARRWVERALERLGAGGGAARRLAGLRAALLRREGDTGAAIEAFERLARGRDEVAADALLALAKLHEHGARDPARALDCCERLRTLAETALTGRAYARAVRGLPEREQRLVKKVARDA